MSVNTVSSTQGTAAATPALSGPQALTSTDFMQLLAVQFQSQDPLKPMDDTAFISQMAQFTTLSQTQTLTTQMAKLSSDQELVAANSYIGRQVTVDNGNGGIASGVVSGVQVGGTGPQIMVAGQPYTISSVLTVQPAPAPATTASTSTASGGS